MKIRLLKKINLLLTALLSMLGFSSCDTYVVEYGVQVEVSDSTVVVMYGVPNAEYQEDNQEDSDEQVNDNINIE